MKSKKRLLAGSRLYAIIDKKVYGSKPLGQIAAKLCGLGVDMIQYRDKGSQKSEILENAFLLRHSLKNIRVIFIINDYLDIAKISEADGIHLGQTDTSIGIARKVLGPDKIIGVSCHNLAQALAAQAQGADYIGFGPIYPTSTKPEYKNTGIGLDLIPELNKRLRIPFFAIGNINDNNINKVMCSGAKRIAACKAFF